MADTPTGSNTHGHTGGTGPAVNSESGAQAGGNQQAAGNLQTGPMGELVLFEMEGSIARLTLNREKQLNALNHELLTELDRHLDALAVNRGVRVVFLTGAGRAFAAGADIAQMESLDSSKAQEFAEFGQRVFRKIERLPQPVIALVNGFALGGGMELAMACDVRIASEKAKFGQPEVHLGVIPGFGGSQRLPRIVGQGRALEWLLSGDMMDANEALRIGLANRVVPAEELNEVGLQFADKLLAQGPLAIAAVKRAVYDGAEMDLDKGLAMEAALFGLCFSTSEQKEGMSAFLNRRQPSFAEGRDGRGV